MAESNGPTYVVAHKAGAYYDVIGPDGEAVNEKGMKQDEATLMAKDLNENPPELAVAVEEPKEERAPAPAPVEVPTGKDAMLQYMFGKMAEMENRLAEKQSGAALPPPPQPRGARKKIHVWVNPYNKTIREVPDDYDGPLEEDGFKNHERSRLRNRR